MKKTTNTLRYNLSGIMKYAHGMFNPDNDSFSVRLKVAWALAKTYMLNEKATGRFVIAVGNAPVRSYDESIADWYATAPQGTYFGD